MDLLEILRKKKLNLFVKLKLNNMETICYYINTYLLDLLDRLEKTNDTKTLVNLASELKFNILFKVLNEKLFNIALEQGKLINSFFGIKNISRNPALRLYPDFLQQGVSKDEENKEQIFLGIILFKGTLMKVIESMGLEKTKKVYVKQLVIEDEEIDEKTCFSKEELSKFDMDSFETILKQELNEKFKNKPLIINKDIKKGKKLKFKKN